MMQKFIFPAVILSSLALVLLTGLIIKPIPVNASSLKISDCALSPDYSPELLQWCALIEQHAAKLGLEPALLAALIWEESGGDPNAISHQGAVGLMQVMPNDGLAASFQCVNGPCFAERPSTQQLLDPDFNLAYGSQLLASLIRRNNDLRDALKAYGPSGVGYRYADAVLYILASHR